MKSYQDLIAAGENEAAKMAFVFAAITEHKGTTPYIIALDAEQYYRGLNPRITKYEKIIYDMRGDAHVDKWTPNHKIASNFFNFAITQENQYLLGNGATFTKDDTKAKLGDDFDTQLQDLGKKALVGGVAFGFFNLDHIDTFSLLEFVPLYDEENGALRAGIRFWQVSPDKPMRATLYEEDGYTDYLRANDKSAMLHEKRPYKLKIRTSEADGEEIYDGENYPTFPIVPLWGNDKKQSELVGRQGTLDAFDLLNSNLINNLDEANYIYWVLTNCGGMDDMDDAKFIEQLKTTHVAHADGDSGATAEAHTIEAPYQASESAIQTVQRRLYEDFMCLDVNSLSAANKTATEIKAAYQPLDSKCDMYEYCVIEFVQKILELAGINDKVTFTRSKIVNKSDEINTLLAAQAYLDDETLVEQVCQILGIADQTDEIIRKRRTEEQSRFEVAE
nr:MAG TPA: PORTAL PROTEIN [Caudoviricetes sp.]